MATTNKERLAIVETKLTNIESIVPKINKMHDTFLRGSGKINNNTTGISDIKKVLNGNGNPGLISKVNKIDRKMAFYAGGLAVIVTAIQLIFQFVV